MNILILAVIFFLTLSITLFDLDLRKAKKATGTPTDKTDSFQWVGLIYIVCIVSWVIIVFVDWKVALLGVAVYYASAFIPLPQFIGKILVSPFNRQEK